MNRALWKKCIGEAYVLVASCSLLLFSFAWLWVWTVGLINNSQFSAIIGQFWEDFQYMSPVSLGELLSFPGRVVLGYIDPIVVFTMSFWAIARGSDAVAGELNRGTLEMLLAQPLGRLHVLAVHSTVTILGTAAIATALWCGTWAGISVVSVEEEAPPASWKLPFLPLEIPNLFGQAEPRRVPISEKVDAIDIIPGAFNLFSLGVCVAGIATLASSCDRYRWRAIGVATGVFAIQFITKAIAVTAPPLAWLKCFTFFTAYEPQVFVASQLDSPPQGWTWLAQDENGLWSLPGALSYNGLLLGIGLLAYLLAAVIFVRRDLPAPA